MYYVKFYQPIMLSASVRVTLGNLSNVTSQWVNIIQFLNRSLAVLSSLIPIELDVEMARFSATLRRRN